MHRYMVLLLDQFWPVFRIRISFNADPDVDPDPTFKVKEDPNADQDQEPDPGFWWPKTGKNLQMKKIVFF